MSTGNRIYYQSKEDTLTVSNVSPLSYVEWLKYENTFDKNVAFEQYTLYLVEWYSRKGVSSAEQQQDYIRGLYINLLKQISIEYTTPEEKRFLSNIDYQNNNDLDIALPFFTKKIKQIAIYYAGQRDELKYSKVKSNLRGSSLGISQIIYKQLADLVNNDTEIVTQLNNLNLTTDDVLLDLNIEVEELYDTEQNYFNIPESSNTNEYIDDTNSTRYNYFDTSIIPNNHSKLFLSESYNQAVIDTIKQVPITMYITTSGDTDDGKSQTLVSSTNEAFSISEIVTGTELDRLSDDLFINYNNTGELKLNYEQLAFQKYIGTDYYYLSTGDTISETVSGKLFSASAPHKNLLNKYYPTIASVVGENLYKIQFLGGFFTGTGVGLASYTSFDFEYKFTPKENTTYYFPDPASGINGYYGSYNKYESPVTYYDNVNWNKKDATTHYAWGQQKQWKNIPRFYPYINETRENAYNAGVSRYNDSFDFWTSDGQDIWTSPDIFGEQLDTTSITSRQNELISGDKIVYKWKTDIYGNNFILTKDNISLEPEAPVNMGTSINDSEYIVTTQTKKSTNREKYDWQSKQQGSLHSSKNLTEQKTIPGNLIIRNNTYTGTETITDDSVSSIYSKYKAAGTIQYEDIVITITDIGDEIENQLIDFDIINDILILETTNYIIFDKIDYNYETGLISSGQKQYNYVKKNYSDSAHYKVGNWWYDEDKSRILLCMSNVYNSDEKTNNKMIYPVLYSYSISDMSLKQVYPDPDYNNAQLIYETSRYSLSAIDGEYNITSSKEPILTYNRDSERYTVSQLMYDNCKNVYYMKTDFRLFQNTIELITNNFYKNNYFINSYNSYNTTVPDYITETNPALTATPQWYHDTGRNTVFMSSTDSGTGPTPVPLSNSVWTYGIESDSYDSDRDIVICFDMCMYGAVPPEGISVVFYNSRNATNSAYTNLSSGGLGPAFNYLDDVANGSNTNASLTGVGHGHACVCLDVGGTYGGGNLLGGTSPAANSVLTTGPFESTQLYRNVEQLDTNKYKLYDSTITSDTISYLRCRVTLTDLGRRVLVDLMRPDVDTTFERVSDTQISDYFPIGAGGTTTTTTTTTPTTTTTATGSSPSPYYTIPPRLNVSLVSCNSATTGGVVALQDITITGYSPLRSSLVVSV